MSSSKEDEVNKIEEGENLENFIVNELQRQRQQVRSGNKILFFWSSKILTLPI